MHHQHRRRHAGVEREVPVADRVQRVAARRREAQQLRRVLPVQRIARAGQRAGAQRRVVGTRARVGQPQPVPPQHLVPGQQVVAQGHRLRRLQVREARHHGVRLRLGARHQRLLQPQHGGVQLLLRGARVQPQVGRHLVVARAPGVQLLAERADLGHQQRLDVHVHVLESGVELRRPGIELLPHRVQTRQQGVPLRPVEHPRPLQTADVRLRAPDVERVQLGVDMERRGEVLHRAVGRPGEAPAPGFWHRIRHRRSRCSRLW